MLTIALPKKIEYLKGDEPNQGSIIIEPCFPGYGVTLGNSIMRVLLSSLPGAAVVGVKIEGVSHEFMALSYLKEDILEFVLNLKKLRMKIFSDEIIKLELEIHGKKEIKASDIKKNSEVEIVNPDLVLGNIVDMPGGIKAEFFVKKGMGYETIESRESKEKEINYIELDSIYSPVLAVGIKIDNVRVGKLTNFDRLALNIKTDGSITPEEAFGQSIKILIEQFGALLSPADKNNEVEIKSEVIEKIADEQPFLTASLIDSEIKTHQPEMESPKKKRGRPKKSE